MLVRVFVLAAIFFTAVQSSSFAAWQNLEVFNNSGFAISELYVSDSDYGGWGGNLLSGTLANGQAKTISYNAGRTYYDVRIVFPNGQVREWTGNHKIDLSGAWRITIYYNGKAGNGADIFSIHKN